MNSYQALIESELYPVGRSGNDIIYICPFCDDKSGHLYINYDKNKLHCFKCNYKSKNLVRIIKDLNIPTDFDYDDLDQNNEIRKSRLESIIENKEENIRYIDYSVNLDTLTEFYYRNTKDLSQIAINYLLNRGLTYEMISFYKIREGINLYKKDLNINGKLYKGIDYSNRILIPSLLKDGRVSYYVARDYVGLSSRKYMNPPKELSYASEDVWCIELVETPNVIICEGVFTALSINSRLNKHIAVSTYGKDIATKSNSDTKIRGTSQLTKLLDREFDMYLLFYDKDATENMYRCAKELKDYECNVRCAVIVTDKYGEHADAADLTDEELLDCITNSKEYSSLDHALVGLTI